MSISEIISWSIDNWLFWLCIVAFFYAGYNFAEIKYYKKGYMHGYRRAKAIYGERNLK